jgi:hypothetical protein
MEQKHTPGPWRNLRRNGMGNLVVGQADRVAPLGVADVFVSSVDGADEANANLIAAAPDLLAACRALVDWYDTHAPDVTGCSHEAYELAYAAVRKAQPTPAVATPADSG